VGKCQVYVEDSIHAVVILLEAHSNVLHMDKIRCWKWHAGTPFGWENQMNSTRSLSPMAKPCQTTRQHRCRCYSMVNNVQNTSSTKNVKAIMSKLLCRLTPILQPSPAWQETREKSASWRRQVHGLVEMSHRLNSHEPTHSPAL